MKKLLILLVFVAISAQETTHGVVSGETLWDIAGFYYQNPFLWPYIWRANLTRIEDPHWIYPEQSFIIPPSPEEMLGEVPEVPEYVPEEVTILHVPEGPTAEVVLLVTPETRIFSEEFVHRAGFILEDDIPYWGKIIGTECGDDVVSTSRIMIAMFDKVYIDRATDIEVDDVLTIYRSGKTITHPKTGKNLGKEIIVLGKAEVEAIAEGGSRCKIIASYDIIHKGDLVTPYIPILAPEHVELIPTQKELDGYVVELKTLGVLTLPHVFTYIDMAEDDGVAVGDKFTVYRDKGDLPDFDIAEIQIISVFKKASIGLLLWKRETALVKRGERCRLAMEAR